MTSSWQRRSLQLVFRYFGALTGICMVISLCQNLIKCCVVIMKFEKSREMKYTQIARFIGQTWGLSGADKTEVGPILVPWTLLSGSGCVTYGETPCNCYTYFDWLVPDTKIVPQKCNQSYEPILKGITKHITFDKKIVICKELTLHGKSQNVNLNV